MKSPVAVPARYHGIGYTRNGDSFPLEAVEVAVPRPGPNQVLIHVLCSSLNPLEYKLAELNFLGRTPPVILGFDLAGIVVATGEHVREFAMGDEVMAMAELSGDGGWAVGDKGGYALAPSFLTIKKPDTLTFRDAAVLPICFLSAFAALYREVRTGDTVYIPGGGGGVAHLAVQMAARTLGASKVVSSGSTSESMSLARSSGAHHVFNYKQDEIPEEIGRLTNGRGVDIVYDTTYNEDRFVRTAEMVREGGTWIVLGVGPGKTTRTKQKTSPVDDILGSRHARHVNVNLLRYFSDPATLDPGAQAFLQFGLKLAVHWEAKGQVRPHVGGVIVSAVDQINSGLQSMKAGKGSIGKTAVIVDSRCP